MKKLLSLLLLVLFSLALVSCASEPEPSDDPGEFYDPARFIAFDEGSVSGSAEALTVTLKNDSSVDISLSSNVKIFKLVGNDWGTVSESVTIPSTVVAKQGKAPVTLDLSDYATASPITVTVTYTWVNGAGALRTGEVSFSVTLADNTPDPEPDLPSEDRDVKLTPIAELTESEGATLAKYLFELYVPNCFGIFDNTKDLSSATLWASIDALNRNVDGDQSNLCLTREDALKKAARYYPGATLVPEDVRLFDKTTDLFRPAPAQVQNYKFLSYEIKGDTIVIYYEDVPEDTDQTPGQYATTLKNSAESGYFSFVSTIRVGAVG